MAILGRPFGLVLGAFALAAAVACGTSADEPSEGVGSVEQTLGCSKHAQCEDGNPCTQNLCTLGLCLPALPVLGCCFNGNCFDDGQGGAGGQGGAATEPLSCSAHEQCSDGDKCTENLCVLGLCTTLPVLGCVLGQGGAGGEGPILPLLCANDDQCEDGHPCTQNLCVAGLCAALPVLGCCWQGSCVDGEGGAGGVGGEGGGAGAATGGTNTGGSGNGGANSSGADAGGADTGGTDTGGSDNAGGQAATTAGNAATGGDDGVAGSASNGGNPSAGSNGSGAVGNDDGKGARAADWVMEGGSCSMSTPRSTPALSLGLLALGLGAVLTRRRRRLAALGLAAPLALSATAHAAGFAQDGYTAPAAPDDLMWTERAGSDSGHVRPFGRLTLGFTDDPLVLVDANDSSREIRVVDDQFALYGAFGLGFAHRAHLAVLMPLYAQSTAISGSTPVDGTRAGDLGIDGRFTILDRHAPIELALAATLRVPTGDQESFASDGRASVWPRLLLSKQLSESGSLINLSVGPVLRREDPESSVETGNQLRFAAGALVALSNVVGITAEAAGSTLASDTFEKRSTPVEGALGGRLTFDSLVLGSTVGTGLAKGVGSPDFRWLVMLQVPGPFREPPPAAPVKDLDPDRDGIRGDADACPNEPEDLDGFEDQDGCPETDNDKDGILDATDKCPAEAEDKDGFQDEDGCPEGDNDADGIADAADKCPDKAEDLDNWQDEDGCPEDDNDADGVPDAQDKCPNEAETKNGIADDDGCPDLLRVEEGQIRTLEPIFFEYNKAKIQARSEPLLLEMGNLIQSRADLGTIAIEGYTDSRGSAAYNLKLSRERAAAVRTFLIAHGVSQERLTSDGFGPDRPIDDNKTEAGRAKNRRVEFRFGQAPAATP